MQPIKINVVVLAHNYENYIVQCLDSILQQKGDYNLEGILWDTHEKQKQIYY